MTEEKHNPYAPPQTGRDTPYVEVNAQEPSHDLQIHSVTGDRAFVAAVVKLCHDHDIDIKVLDNKPRRQWNWADHARSAVGMSNIQQTVYVATNEGMQKLEALPEYQSLLQTREKITTNQTGFGSPGNF